MSDASNDSSPTPPGREALYWVPLAAVFPIVGFVTGWLSGASQTPVIAGLLPLIIGLLGVLNLGLLQRTFHARKVADQLKQFDEVLRSQIQDAFNVPVDTSLRLPAFWALAVASFSVACFIGVSYGVMSRWSAPARFESGYPTLQELLTPQPATAAAATSSDAKPKSSPGTSTVEPSDPDPADDAPQPNEVPDVLAPTNDPPSRAETTSPNQITPSADSNPGEVTALERDYRVLIDTVVEIVDEQPQLIPLLWQRLTEKDSEAALRWRKVVEQQLLTEKDSEAALHWRKVVEQQLLAEGYERAGTPAPLIPSEMAILHVFYLRCRHAKLPHEEVKSIFADAINPTTQSPQIGRIERLQAIVNTMFPVGGSGGGESSNPEGGQTAPLASPGIAPLPSPDPAAAG